MVGMRTLILAAVATLAVSGCGSATSSAPDPGEVSRASLGTAWPLSVDHGTLQGIGTPGDCAVIFWAPDGSEYAVNGTARSKLEHVQPVDAIRTGDVGPLVRRGLKLCG